VDHIFFSSESKLESTESSTIGDSTKGSSYVVLRQKASIYIYIYIVTRTFIPGFLLFGPGSKFESTLVFKESSGIGDPSKDSTEGSS